jgi:CDP-glycerol glycerophosphotransferase
MARPSSASTSTSCGRRPAGWIGLLATSTDGTFTYDLDRFGDEVRGFYFDLEQHAPGPMLQTQDDLADALLDLPGVSRSYADRYERFRERFCHLEDGHAGQRVLDRLWNDS